ncbi:hypothetical protein MPSEU_000520800 [Mayamaea pseudoterrestris]|nr:hypothetical protein MPSEU_000520800 [Mayamaea pseudoterrestris]
MSHPKLNRGSRGRLTLLHSPGSRICFKSIYNYRRNRLLIMQQVVRNEDNKAHKIDDSFAKLVVPWAFLVAVAIACACCAIHQFSKGSESDDFSFPTGRKLIDSVLNSTTHYHHQVINEAHKPLFPLDSSDYWGFFFATIGLMIAAGGGVGGGGILVPVYLLVMHFSPKQGIPLSNVTVLGGAIANTILNIPKRHPDANRPLVDWDLILVMEPLTIAGALIGAFLNKILPETLLILLLVALLTFTSWETLTKAVKMYKKETKAMKAEQESELTKLAAKMHEDDDDEAEESLLKNVETREDDEERAEHDEHVGELPSDLHKELQLILEDERKMPMANIKILVALFVVVLMVNLLKGGGAFKSPLGIRCGSNGFWMANVFMLVWIVAISFYARSYLVKKHYRKIAVGFEFLEGDIKWDERATIVYPIICAAAGFFAGMFGVGGGIVKGPLMLAMGVHPKVSSACSAVMILFTSFTATTSFIVFGLLLPEYAILLGIMGFVTTYIGQVGLTYLMNKSGRNSLIAFSIGGVVALSAVLMTIQSLMAMAAGETHHTGGLCGKGD